MNRRMLLTLTAVISLDGFFPAANAASSEQPTVPLPPNSQSTPEPRILNGQKPGEEAGSKETVTDAGITTLIKTKLLVDKATSGLNIGVETNNGVVTLTGEANSQTEKTQAEKIASATDGVTHVSNRLTIRTQ